MIARLVVQGLRRGRARFACAVAGLAVATGAVVFTTSLVATNNAQAPTLARRAAAPWEAWEVRNEELGIRNDHHQEPAGEYGQRAVESPRSSRPPIPHSSFLIPNLQLHTVQLTVDYRPGGRVLQGPPMRALMADAPAENPYAAVSLAEGRWVDAAGAEPEVVCVRRAMRRFGAAAPALGESLKFVGRHGTMTARIVGYLDGELKLPPQFPTVFANPAAFAALSAEPHGEITFHKEVCSLQFAVDGESSRVERGETWRESSCSTRSTRLPVPKLQTANCKLQTPASESVVAAYRSDEQRRMDYARPLMLVAAVLTALSLLVNSLLLSVEANRRTLATLRMVGLTRGGVVGFVALESLLAGAVGWLLGVGGALGALALYVAADSSAFPVGAAFDFGRIGLTLAALPFVILLAVLFALGPALRVRAMDVRARTPRTRRRGMAATFALGFAAFVAVEVWGASLMRAFIPSPEWPDAIVSLLPGGASAFDIEKLRGIEGVRRISELLPLQVWLAPDGMKNGDFSINRLFDSSIELRQWTNETFQSKNRLIEKSKNLGDPVFKKRPNVLLLASEWLPRFRFTEGTWEEAERGIRDGGVVIAEMLSRAHNLHLGDNLPLALTPQTSQTSQTSQTLPIVGVVDLNWHMVTSRGLVRGLNRMPVMTDGPAFASFNTVESLDRRPAPLVRMTHLWVEYEPDFLARHGVFGAGRRVEAEIARRLGNPTEATVRLHARDEIADGTLAHGSAVIGAAARVPFVFLFILAIGFVAMLVAEADARRQEFATLRAVGATRRQLAWRLAAAAVRTALVGIAAGLPLGALAGWLTSFKTAAIWPGMPHYFVLPVRIVAEGALGALLFALLFALPASLRLIPRRRERGRG